MLGLKLRDEFLGSQMPNTAIALRRADNKGAAQQPPEQILDITYPTADVQSALRNISSARAGRPIVLMGDRGRGKSHIMAVMHHAIASPGPVESWVQGWCSDPSASTLAGLTMERGFVAISEPVHNHEYPLLWDLLFDRHPKGEYYRGQFENMNQPFPPRSLLERMFEEQPSALILDEFQKWFDGLHDEEGSTGRKWRECASNFIQNLSEIAKDRPEILILVISVLNNTTEAFRQVHRNDPVVIDFRGPTAKHDRQKLVLHRLFTNRGTTPNATIEAAVCAYANERWRLKHSHLPESERSRIAGEVTQTWPFAPELLALLEEHILMAAAAQETRDLIRILAHLYRARGEDVPILTPADFFVDDDSCGVQSLLDSIAVVGEQERLREIAQANLETVRTSGETVPHARELISALWMRSMSPGRNIGATRSDLQLDITRDGEQDDNAFQTELNRLIENSRNIHGDESPDGRLRFEIQENPRSLVRSVARNDRLWQEGATPSPGAETVFPKKDLEFIQSTLRHLLVPEGRQPGSRVIVLGPKWDSDPWAELDESDKPNRWERQALMVMPSPMTVSGAGQVAGLGEWMKAHMPSRFNMARFLLLAAEEKGIYDDPELRFLSRCAYLTGDAWSSDPKYRALKGDFDRDFRDRMKARYDRFAVLKIWDFPNPANCRFEVERVGVQGGEIPSKVEEKLVKDLFDPAEFQKLVVSYATNSDIVGKLLDDLAEAPAPGRTAMIYLGETQTYEEVLKVAARGKIELNVNGAWVARQAEHTDDDAALRYIRGKAWRSGQEMRNVQLALPGSASGSTVTGAGGATTPTTPTGAGVGGTGPTPGGTVPPGSLFTGGGTTPTGGGTGVVTPPGGTQPPVTVPKTQSVMDERTGINLCGAFEQWGVDASTTLARTKIEFHNLSVQQVKQILQRLPSAFKATMEITYTEDQG